MAWKKRKGGNGFSLFNRYEWFHDRVKFPAETRKADSARFFFWKALFYGMMRTKTDGIIKTFSYQ